jgi:hypothetical protein
MLSKPGIPTTDLGDALMHPSSKESAFKTSATPAPGARTNVETVWQFLERSTEPMAFETRGRWDRCADPDAAWSASRGRGSGNRARRWRK